MSTHYTMDGQVIATFVCNNGEITELDIPDEVKSEPGLRAWLQCVKNQYNTMMAWINGDPGNSAISNANNRLNGLPYITELQVAISAGIWCATR